MSGKSWVVILICALVASVILIPDDGLMNISGFAVHPIYEGFSTMRESFDLYSDLIFTSTDSYKTLKFAISDSVVYKTAYISINGSVWRPVTMTGSSTVGNWVLGSATSSTNIFPIQVPSGANGDNYIAIYSCTRIGSGWDCNDNRWQISEL